MSREERQRLLHEGTSTTTTLSAFVEIIFDSAYWSTSSGKALKPQTPMAAFLPTCRSFISGERSG